MQVYAASITGVLRTILIILALFFAVRLLGRLLGPYLNGVKKRSAAGSADFQNRQDSRQEGEVRIEYTKKDREMSAKKDSKSGEYIDFEEVD